MARYPLTLPPQLKEDAEDAARRQGLSLNQFILWAVAEKIGALSQDLDDPSFPAITYRRGASGRPTPIVRGAGTRVQTLAVAAGRWGMAPDDLALEFGLRKAVVREALAFYDAHRAEVDALVASDEAAEAEGG